MKSVFGEAWRRACNADGMIAKYIRYFAAVAALVGFCAASVAQEEESETKQQVEALLARLDLDEAQAEQFRSVMEAQRGKRRELLDAHGFDLSGERRANRKALRSAAGDLKQLRKETEEQLESFLTEAQMETYFELRKEMKGNLKQKLKQRRE